MRFVQIDVKQRLVGGGRSTDLLTGSKEKLVGRGLILGFFWLRNCVRFISFCNYEVLKKDILNKYFNNFWMGSMQFCK